VLYLAEDLYPKDTLLLLMRSVWLMRNCTSPLSPDKQLRYIAIKAAEAHGWPIFIRAHLDMINNYVETFIPSHYRYSTLPNTPYLAELELLDIPVQELL
jgi:hypothetical protein